MSNSMMKSFREQKVLVPGGGRETVYFDDTKPNYVYLSNPTNSTLYVGENGNVDPTTYDQIIAAYGADIYISFRPLTSLTLFNSSEEDFYFVLKSWDGEFDPSALSKSTNVSIMSADGLLGIVDVNNILSPLPPGENHIGEVTVRGFDGPLPLGTSHIGAVTVDQFNEPLPTGQNHIGKVSIQNMGSLLPGNAHIGSVGIDSMIPLVEGSAHIGKITLQHSQFHAVSSAIHSGTEGQLVTVQATSGIVFEVTSDNGEITLFNGSNQAWKKGDFKSENGLLCSNGIKIKFDATDTVYILYKGMM